MHTHTPKHTHTHVYERTHPHTHPHTHTRLYTIYSLEHNLTAPKMTATLAVEEADWPNLMINSWYINVKARLKPPVTKKEAAEAITTIHPQPPSMDDADFFFISASRCSICLLCSSCSSISSCSCCSSFFIFITSHLLCFRCKSEFGHGAPILNVVASGGVDFIRLYCHYG